MEKSLFKSGKLFMSISDLFGTFDLSYLFTNLNVEVQTRTTFSSKKQ